MKCKMCRRSDGVMSHNTTIGLAAGLLQAGPAVARLNSDLYHRKKYITRIITDYYTIFRASVVWVSGVFVLYLLFRGVRHCSDNREE